jgi:hypothetical protein
MTVFNNPRAFCGNPRKHIKYPQSNASHAHRVVFVPTIEKGVILVHRVRDYSVVFKLDTVMFEVYQPRIEDKMARLMDLAMTSSSRSLPKRRCNEARATRKDLQTF